MVPETILTTPPSKILSDERENEEPVEEDSLIWFWRAIYIYIYISTDSSSYRLQV